ncbi:sensor histidine kinase [uncultured Corynebacterium sp.]|uniref:sensor histidine kinase n=1 Tax=uncultured Corynebacterium sp. TaxID=159447 RepID=UPI0026369E0A|nr:sensor histidine kinase [uncultured Corynebacterium sp.]
MATNRHAPGFSYITVGIHIITALLLAVTVATSLTVSILEFMQVSFLAVTFGAIYYAGNHFFHQLNTTQHGLWAFGLTALWILLLPHHLSAVYLVAALYFVYLRSFDERTSTAAILGATGIVIVANIPTGITVGAVVGPLLGGVVTIGIAFVFRRMWRMSAEKEELIDQLMKTRSQLAESEHEAGMAAERQRIAHEIHDTVAQGLSSIQMLLSVAEADINAGKSKEEPLKKIAIAKKSAADNLAEARAMIAALQPAALAKTNLEGALERIAENIESVDVNISVEGEDRQLPMRTETTLLRIAQGALGNVVKHSQATATLVTLTYDPDEVRLDVVDNGVGFDPAQVVARPRGLGHIGLDAMRERAREVDGTLAIESTPGQGTAISVAVPIINTMGDERKDETLS